MAAARVAKRPRSAGENDVDVLGLSSSLPKRTLRSRTATNSSLSVKVGVSSPSRTPQRTAAPSSRASKVLSPRKLGQEITAEMQHDENVEPTLVTSKRQDSSPPAKSTHPTLSPARTPSSRSSKHPFQRLPSTPRTPQTVYQEAKALFRRCSTPTRLVGRNNERQELQSFLQTHAGVGKPGALYVSGIPGTGKTALVDEVVREFKKGCGELSHDLVTVKVNCMAMKDPKMVYAKIIGEIEPDSHYSTKDAFKPLENAIVGGGAEAGGKRRSKYFIVILDEIDTLLTRDQDVLYTLFEWPHLAGSRLILIGIANALDLTDRFLPRLKARNCAPRLLNFTPYDIKEITQIIKERLRCLESSETDTLRENVLSPASTTKIATTVLGNMTPTTRAKVGTPLMQDMAIELCARKMAGTGDLRKALDVCRHAIEMVEAESKKKVANGSVFHNNSFAANPAPGTPTPRRNASLTSTAGPSPLRPTPFPLPSTPIGAALTTPTTAETPLLMDTPLSSLDTLPKVTVKHILSATNAVFGSPVVNRIKALSLHCKMVLCALVVMARAPGGGRDTTMSKVYETYVTLSKHPRIDIQPVTRTELQDVITNLETAALVTLSNTASIRSGKMMAAAEGRLAANRKVVLTCGEGEVVKGVEGMPVCGEALRVGVE